jgi:serine/threonine-protein kinase
MHARDDTLDSDSLVELGLRAAFGAPGPDDVGALTSLEGRLGFQSRVLLREEPDETVHLVNPRSAERPETGARYQVLGEIARGGVGVVMKGRDTDLGRDVAMKMLRATHADSPSMVQRFVEEAQISGQLQHPGILPVYELVVKGRTLSALLEDRSAPTDDRPRFLKIFEQIAQTIAYAHSRGVVHRDLKPSNIMVGPFGEVLVVDWGLAKVLTQGGIADEQRVMDNAERTSIQTVRTDQPGSHSIAGSVMGTPAYMAPEQARGDVARVDERCDVFALGGMLCEILTGHGPYAGETERTLEHAAAARLGPALERLEGCGADPELIQLATACLAPAVTARPRDAKAVADAIAAHLASVEERAREADRAAAAARSRAASERRTRRLTLGLAATITLAVIVAGVGFVWVERDRHERRVAASESVETALNAASVLLGEAKVAALTDDAAWSAVDTAGRHLTALVVANPVDAATAGRVEAFTAQLERAQRDRRLVQLIEEAVVIGATHEDRESWLWMEQELRRTFVAYGIDVLAMTKEEVARRIRESELAAQLTNGLELWIATCFHLAGQGVGSFSVNELMPWVDVLYDADPDPLRMKIRQQLYSEMPDREVLMTLLDEIDFEAEQSTTLSWLASTFFRVGDQERVVAIYRRAVLVHPTDFMLNFDYAYHLVYMQQWEQAIRYYVRCLGIRPGSGGVWRCLGVAFREIDDLDEAERALRQSIRHQGDYAPTHVELSRTLRLRGDADGAVAAARQALAIEPDLPIGLCALGRALQDRGDLDDALPALKRGHELGSVRPGWTLPSAQWIADCEHAIETARDSRE